MRDQSSLVIQSEKPGSHIYLQKEIYSSNNYELHNKYTKIIAKRMSAICRPLLNEE
jgi:hypothetical protein